MDKINRKSVMKRKSRFKKSFFKMYGYFVRQNILRSETEQLRYLPQSVLLEEAANPYFARMTMMWINAAIIVFVLWSALTNINEVAKAKGEVVPQGFVQVVQHLDGGIVTDIHTGEGDLVKKNQILLQIDDGSTKQDLAQARAKQLFLNIEAERLRAIVDNKKPDFSKIISASGKSNNSKSMGGYSYSNDPQLRKLYNRFDKLKKNLQIAKETLSLHAKMHKQGHVSKLTILQHQKEVSKIEEEIHKELNDVEAQLAQNVEIVRKLNNKLKRLQVRSPVYGLVKGMKINTIGGVIDPGETLMEIVPLDKNLVVEANISPKDVGHVHVGQPVKVAISSYDFTRYGAAEGVLEFLSATTFLDENGASYYRARISLQNNYVGKDKNKNPILPGMIVDADIVTGKKSILAYLLKPIHLSVNTAFTER